MAKNSCLYLNLGLVDYQTAWDLQKKLAGGRLRQVVPNLLLLLEHPHTITIGKTGDKKNLLVGPEVLKQKKIELKKVDRGGDVTYHGPGQLVGYPILDLSVIKQDVIWYLRFLEKVIIQTLADYQIKSEIREKYTGVWANDEKIAAIGVNVSRWITTHGFALNVNPDLSYFNFIIPCGIRNKNVTSMVTIKREPVSVNEVIPKLVNQFGRIFNCKMIPYNHYTWPELKRILEEWSNGQDQKIKIKVARFPAKSASGKKD